MDDVNYVNHVHYVNVNYQFGLQMKTRCHFYGRKGGKAYLFVPED